MTSRPKHVGSLSDKIAGLKFMQRAQATLKQVQPGASSSSSVIALSEPQDDPQVQKDINEEHWSLPASKNHRMEQGTISHEPGWNAWLIEADDVPGSEAKGALSSRRSFGTWVTKKKKKKKEKTSTSPGSKESAESEDDMSYKDSSDEESNASDNGYLKSKGFIKPGQKQAMSDLSSFKSISDKQGKGIVPQTGDKRKDQRREKDKGMKRKSRDSLSGFPNDNGKPPKKNKKPKTQ